MSSIKWDRNHIHTLLSWVEDSHGLLNTTLHVESSEFEERTFAISIYPEDREIRLLSDPEWSLMDVAMHTILAYVVCLSFEKDDWATDLPSEETLSGVLDEVCETLMDLNSIVSEVLGGYLHLLLRWRDAYEDASSSSFNLAALLEYDSLSSGDSAHTELEDSDNAILGGTLFGATKKSEWDLN